MNVAGQNIANADSAGYARRRLLTRADSYGTLGFNASIRGAQPTGSGVSLHSYTRLRDQLLSTSAFRANGQLEFSSERHRILSSVEGILHPVDSGLGDRLNEFWNSWSDVTDNPTDVGVRSTLLSRAQALASNLNQADSQLQQLEADAKSELEGTVSQVNGILARIADLNSIIAQSENKGSPDFAAADERDDLVRQLSGLTGVEVQQNHHDGFYIAIGGVFVVEGEHATTLNLDSNNLKVTFGNTGTVFNPETGGKLGGTLRTLGTDIPALRQKLDTIALTLVTEINALHQTGYGLDDSIGLDFFDSSGVTASSIQISDDIISNPLGIAVSNAAGSPGNSENARRISDLRLANLVGSRTIGDAVIDMVGALGSEIASAAGEARGQAGVLSHLDAMESAVSGVSVEDEMTSIIELQQAYAATARVLRATETMIDTLLAI
jgi:flagellar hook-associated protein 1 FlgK